MEWYAYTYKRGRIKRELIRPMTESQAAELGATLVPDFDPSTPIAGIFVVTFPPEGQFEGTFPVTSEAPAGRLA